MATIMDGSKGGKHNSDQTIASFTPKKKKQYYFDLHVNDGGKHGHSVFLAVKLSDLFYKGKSDQMIAQMAVQAGLIDSEDAKHVDNVREIDADEYARATA